ncbi:MAG: hypothetical protein ABEJ95_04725 [Candidatus Nanohalobium sp.]
MDSSSPDGFKDSIERKVDEIVYDNTAEEVLDGGFESRDFSCPVEEFREESVGPERLLMYRGFLKAATSIL